MDPAIIVFGFGVGALVGMTGMGGGIADDAFADPALRRQAGDRDRHRHLLRRGDQDGRRLAPPADEDGQPRPRLLARGRQRAVLDRRRLADLDPADEDRRGGAGLDRLRAARRHPADGRDHHPGAGADPQRPDRGARRLRDQAPAQGRRGPDRRHDRLRDRRHLGRLGDGDRDPADRDLPPDAAEGGRHRRLSRRGPALGGGPGPLGRGQRRLRAGREHPPRLGSRE